MLIDFNRPGLFLFLAFGVVALPGRAQQAAPAGVVTAATRATNGSGNISEGATVFSGDLLRTTDEGHLNVQSGTLQFALGPNSTVRIFRTLNRVIVEIERGTLAYTAKGASEDLTIYASDIRAIPKTNVPAAGRITIISRCDVNVSAVRSAIEVTSGGETKTIEETNSYRVLSEFGVDYHDSWQPVLADYPDFPKDAQYHHSHSHVACPAGVWQAPIAAAHSHFGILVGGGTAVITGYALHEVFESPDRP